jgi:hypothetical protein
LIRCGLGWPQRECFHLSAAPALSQFSLFVQCTSALDSMIE